MSFNTVNLMGNVASDAELKTTSSGKSVTNLRLAVNKPGKDNGADFFTIVLWEKQAEVAVEYATKGTRIGIEGRLSVNEFTDKDGNKQSRVEVIAGRLHLLGSPKRDEDQAAPAEAEADADAAIH